MSQRITWVGIDDHIMSLSAAVQRGVEDSVSDLRKVANEDRALRRWVRRLERDAAGGEIRRKQGYGKKACLDLESAGRTVHQNEFSTGC